MPYIIVRGNLASYDNKYPWRVLVSGLKSDDIEGLRKYPCGGYCDECTIVYLQHPCVILSALEKLGYQIVASSSTSVKQDYNEYVWTMGKIASYDSSIDSESQTTYQQYANISNTHRMFHAQCCKSKNNNPAVTQTLDELDYERGIWSAANDGYLSKVESFLQKGVSADERDSAGYTALHYAAMRGNVDICKLLLQFEADVDARTRAGQATALHRACTAGKKEVVEILLEHGAAVELQDADGRTALHRALLNCRYDVAQLLTCRYPQLLSSVDDHDKKILEDHSFR